MEISKDTLDFNKELVIGEIGAFIGGSIFGLMASLIKYEPGFISFSAVIGSLCGSCVSWLFLRIIHEKRKGKYSKEKLAKDIMFFTPFAFIAALIVYQPILYFISHYLLLIGNNIFVSIIPAQIIAFLCFLIVVNIYRLILYKAIGRKL